MSDPLPVAVTGFTWTAALMTLANVLLGGVLVALIRSRPQLKKIANDREANLLSERAQEMEKMRETIARLEARLDIKDAIHDAERAYDRHRINNLSTSLKAFFMLVKAKPEDAAKAAELIEQMRSEQTEQETKEAIALRELVTKLAVEKSQEKAP